MINSQSISTEAVNVSQSGLKGKKGKGENQSLFTKLLATLQHGGESSSDAKSVADASTTAKLVKGADEQAAKKKGLHGKTITTTVSKDSSKHKNISVLMPNPKAKTEKVGQGQKNSIKEPVLTLKKDTDAQMVAVVQEAPLTPILPTAAKAELTKDTTLFSSVKNKNTQHTILTPTNTQAAQPKAETVLENNKTTPLISETTAQTNLQNVTVAVERKTATPLTQTVSTVETISAQGTSAQGTVAQITANQNNAATSKANAQTSNPQASPIQTTEMKNSTSTLLSETQLNAQEVEHKHPKAAPQTTPINLAKESKAHQHIQPTQQQAVSQPAQQNSNNLTTLVGQQTISQIKGGENNNASTQQDLNSNQQNAQTSIFDSSNSDNKVRNSDFQTHLAYRSQRAFTPADTMLEIVKSAKKGSTSLELQLEPANLGKVHVSIQIDAQKQIQVAFTVDQQVSRQALEQQMPQLKLALSQQGLDLGGFSMQMNQQQHQQEHASSNATPHFESDINNLDQQNLKQTTRTGINLANAGRLNILA
ncbi:MAG: flagellar hook-length control protein FliK [Ghiorsea sp.]